MRVSRRTVLGAGAALTCGAPALANDDPAEMRLSGKPVQGGFVLGRTEPRALVFVDGEALTSASATGLFVVGFDRDAAPAAEIETRVGRRSDVRVVSIAPGQFQTTRIDGLPSSTVEPEDPALLARIAREVEIKTEGFASRDDSDSFRDGFRWPLDNYRVSSTWGAQRVLNGTPARPHYGIDLATPAGSPIFAPADGLVTLAEPSLHFEGGCTFIDHGQGLISVYLHQSAQLVLKGQRVRRGQTIGHVGMTGRATGPHLCWRLKWRDRNLDPSLMVGATAPPA